MKKLILIILLFCISFVYCDNHAPLNISPRIKSWDDNYISGCKHFISKKSDGYVCYPTEEWKKYNDTPSFYIFTIDDFGIEISSYYVNYPNKFWYYYISNEDVIGEFRYTLYDETKWLESWNKGKVNSERAEYQRNTIKDFLKHNTYYEVYEY